MVEISTDRVRQNAEEISRRVGVPVYAVVKADAYGLGIGAVARAIGECVAGFCVFSLREAAEAGLWAIGKKPILALGPPEEGASVGDYLAAHVRPAVTTVEQARWLRGARPAVCVETGMRRFTCPADRMNEVIEAGECREAFTHAMRAEHVGEFLRIAGGRGLHLHAAGSSLTDDPASRLDAVRPGIALYRGAVRITRRLVEVHDGPGRAGYGEFESSRHGIILMGYRQGLRAGPCLVNGVRRRILEVGMQSAYVEIGEKDRVGDEVIVIGEGLDAEEIAMAWGSGAQEVLVSLLRGSDTSNRGGV